MSGDGGKTQKAMKRRGILAAAGAVVAGIVAKGATIPARANDATWSLPYQGTLSYAGALIHVRNSNASSGSAHGVEGVADAPQAAGVHGFIEGVAGYGVFGETGNSLGLPGGIAVYGLNTTGGPGVVGTSTKGNADGVQGTGSGTYSGVAGWGGVGDGTGMIGFGGGTGGTGIIGVAAGARNPGATTNGSGVYGTGRGAGATGVFGDSDSGYGMVAISSRGTGVYGSSNALEGTGGAGVQGASSVSGTYGVHGQSDGGTGVYGESMSGVGGSFAGGLAPLRLAPGAQSARTLGATGHQVGELYVTSDNLLFFFDGTNWRQVLLATPGPGVAPAGAPRPSTQSNPPGPVQPAPPPRSG